MQATMLATSMFFRPSLTFAGKARSTNHPGEKIHARYEHSSLFCRTVSVGDGKKASRRWVSVDGVMLMSADQPV
jgi:hypothetical protein